MTELLLGTALSQEQRRFAQAVYKSGENLLHLLNGLFDFAQLETGNLTLESINFSLQELLRDFLQGVMPQARQKGLSLSYHIVEDIPPLLRGDPHRLRQILLHLVSNAVKFTEQGEIHVEVSRYTGSRQCSHEEDADTSSPGTCRVVLTVRDSGIGIAPGMQQHLFQPFSQADASLTRKYGGTGLGLALSKRLVEVMGGDIQVESALGQGSLFRVTLPFTMVE